MTGALVALLHLLVQLRDIRAASTAEGKEFVIATPSSTLTYDPDSDYPRLVLMMEAFNYTKVTIRTEFPVNQQMEVNQTVDLQPFTAHRFSKRNVYFGPDQSMGVRWSYHLLGSQPFVVLVVMETSATSIETFTAVPVSGWGRKYVTVNLSKQLSVVIIGNDMESLFRVTLRTFMPSNASLDISNIALTTNQEWSTELKKYQSYALSNCGQTNTSVNTLVFEVQSNSPFGMVVGHCDGLTYNRTCRSSSASKTLKRKSRNVMGEMLLPFESTGRFYILFDETGSKTPGLYLQTPVTVGEGKGQQLPGKQVPKNESKFFHANLGAFEMFYLQNSSCFSEGLVLNREGDASLLQLIPVELYYNIYICIIPDKVMKHELILVAESTYLDTINYASTTAQKLVERILFFERYSYSQIAPGQEWGVYRFAVRTNATLTVYSPLARYGCYVVGSSASGTYMHSAGFISTNNNPATCVKQSAGMTPGDLLDNDCDQFVDEDFLIKQNTSGDSIGDYWPHDNTNLTLCALIAREYDCPENLFYHSFDFPSLELKSSGETPDSSWANVTDDVFEEKAPVGETNATNENEESGPVYNVDRWTYPWTEWRCTRNCSNRNKIRTRDCLPQASPVDCPGPQIQTKEADCFVKKCPERDCFGMVFGDECQYSCMHCVRKCDPFNGSCDLCLAGFDYPENGCQYDHRRFDDWTLWGCSEDCLNSRLIRKRLCKAEETNKDKATCTEPVIDSKVGDCFIGKICPKNCSDYKWDLNCVGSCINCDKPCNKFTGICDACRPGFKDPKKACVEACGPNQFGVDCKGDCFEKCAEDCVDRVTGDCLVKSSMTFYLFYLFLLLIPISIFLYFISSRRKDYMDAVLESIGASKSRLSVPSRSKSFQSVRSSRSSRPGMSKSGSVGSGGSPVIPLSLSRSRSKTNVVPKDTARLGTSETIY